MLDTTQNTDDDLEKLMAEALKVDEVAGVAPKVEETEQAVGKADDPVIEVVEAEQATPPAVAEEGEARELVELAAMGVSAMWPVLGYTEETKAKGAQVLAPVFKKYGFKETVLGKYRVEIEAGIFFGGLIIGSIQAVRASKKAEIEKVEMSKKSWFAKFFSWLTPS